MTDTPDAKMVLGMVLSETCMRIVGFGPSKQLCEEFADRVMQQAREAGHDIVFHQAELTLRRPDDELEH